MKKILFIFLLLFVPFYGFSQHNKTIDGFLGIKFGSSIEAVESAISAKGGKLNEDSSTFHILKFTGISVGKKQNIALGVSFMNNVAYRADFTYPVQPESKTVQYYNQVVNELNHIYGPGVSSVTFRPPYREGDGKGIEALKTRNGLYITFWDDPIGGHILATINTSLNVMVIYKQTVITGQ